MFPQANTIGRLCLLPVSRLSKQILSPTPKTRAYCDVTLHATGRARKPRVLKYLCYISLFDVYSPATYRCAQGRNFPVPCRPISIVPRPIRPSLPDWLTISRVYQFASIPPLPKEPFICEMNVCCVHHPLPSRGMITSRRQASRQAGQAPVALLWIYPSHFPNQTIVFCL